VLFLDSWYFFFFHYQRQDIFHHCQAHTELILLFNSHLGQRSLWTHKSDHAPKIIYLFILLILLCQVHFSELRRVFSVSNIRIAKYCKPCLMPPHHYYIRSILILTNTNKFFILCLSLYFPQDCDTCISWKGCILLFTGDTPTPLTSTSSHTSFLECKWTVPERLSLNRFCWSLMMLVDQQITS
jgi:hypothetical protein